MRQLPTPLSNCDDNIVFRPSDDDAYRRLRDEGADQLTASVLAVRNIHRLDDVAPKLSTLPSPQHLSGIDGAAADIAEAIRRKDALWVVGDYDVDGIAATVIAHDCLRAMGANVHWYVPDRLKDGYGLSPAIVEKLKQQGARHIITVDNGISAHEGAQRARELGIKVLVTDHHQPGDKLPAATILNPHLTPDNNPTTDLCGSAVAFYFMAHLRRVMNTDLDMHDFLDLVALGTIADCMPMSAINRTLAHAGLRRIKSGQARPGILALCKASKRKHWQLKTEDIGFALAPKLNAAGRIDDVTLAVRCLMAENNADGGRYAEMLTDINQRRKAMQETAMRETMARLDGGGEDNDGGIVLHDDALHPGIIGIIASGVSQQHNKPAMIFAPAPAGGGWRGSARGPDNYDLHAILCEIHRQAPDVMAAYGGHRRATSVTVNDLRQLRRFQQLFNGLCASHRQPTVAIEVDAAVSGDITPAGVRRLDDIVWGVNFPEPRFVDSFTVSRAKPIGDGSHIRLLLRNSDGATFQAVQFNAPPPATKDVAALYRVNINNYTNTPQLLIEQLWTN